VVVREGEKREKKKEKGKREGEWDTCPIVGGWEKMMLSSPNQSSGDMWQYCKISLFLKPQFYSITT
jgi:hypothetical protein